MKKCFSLIVGISAALFCLCGFTITGYGYFQNSGDAGFPGEYLTSFSAGVRAMGMGSAYTALSGDAAGPYWNPAGLALVKFQELSFLYVPLFGDANYYFFGYAHPFGNYSAFSVNRIGLDSGEANYVTELGEIVGKFRDSQSAYLISYGVRINQLFDLGINFKIVTQNILSYNDNGYGFDIGIIYHPLKNLSCGATIQNILPPSLKLKDGVDIFPVNLKFGVAYKLLSEKLILAFDLDILNLFPDKNLYNTSGVSTPIRWKVGAEYAIIDSFLIRGGINYKEISAGIGFKQRYFGIDYACGVHPLGITHRVGMNVYFGMPLSEQEKLILQEKENLIQKEKGIREKLAEEENILIKKREELKVKEERDVKIRAMLKESYSYLSCRDFKQCEEKVREILKLDPENSEAKDILNEIETKKGKVYAGERYTLALQYFNQKDYDIAEKEINEAIKLNPDKKYEELLHFILGLKYQQEKKYKEAYEELRKVLEINPDNNEAKESALRLKEIIEVME